MQERARRKSTARAARRAPVNRRSPERSIERRRLEQSKPDDGACTRLCATCRLGSDRRSILAATATACIVSWVTRPIAGRTYYVAKLPAVGRCWELGSRGYKIAARIPRAVKPCTYGARTGRKRRDVRAPRPSRL